MERFKDSVAIVTGAGAGIGKATAQQLVAEGAQVVIVDRDQVSGQTTQEELGAKALFVKADVCVSTEVEAAVALCIERFGKLDVLINNVGAPTLGELKDLSLDAWRQTFELDVHSIFHITRLAIPHLSKNKSAAIVNVASVSGLRADRNMGAYNAAKAALINLSRSLAVELGPRGVRTNVVCPGPTATRLTGPLFAMPKIRDAYADACPLGRVAQPQEVAQAIVFLASPQASFINGAVLTVDGGITAKTGQPDVHKLLMGG